MSEIKTKNRVCHLTSVHPRFDTRIFLKMCTSLSYHYEVTLVVADGLGCENKNGVNIVDVGKCNNRLSRIINAPKAVYNKALEVNAQLYHIHDPELLPIALKLRKLGKNVVFDSHEDFPKQLLSKPYLSKWKAKILSKAAAYYEAYAFPKMSALIAATPSIRDKSNQFNDAIDINNYPLLDELHSESNTGLRKRQVCYIGGISTIRGINQTFDAFKQLDQDEVKCVIAGRSSERVIQDELDSHSIKGIEYLGQQNRKQVKEILGNSSAGIVTFLPVPNHIDAQPNKMFEYMSARVPVIGSHFPLWKEIIEGNECGVCIDPHNPSELAEAINKLVSNPEIVSLYGNNGRKAVEQKYNWDIEFKKLHEFYESIIND